MLVRFERVSAFAWKKQSGNTLKCAWCGEQADEVLFSHGLWPIGSARISGLKFPEIIFADFRLASAAQKVKHTCVYSDTCAFVQIFTEKQEAD